jgi:hypothetical protein
MDKLGTTRREPGRNNKQRNHFTSLIKTKLINLSNWLSLAGVSL